MFLSLIPNMKGSVWDFEWMLLKLLNHIFKDFGRNLLSFDIMTMMMWRYWSVSNRVSVQFLGINMQEIMEIRDLSPPGSQKSCKFNQQISSMKKWKRWKKDSFIAWLDIDSSKMSSWLDSPCPNQAGLTLLYAYLCDVLLFTEISLKDRILESW